MYCPNSMLQFETNIERVDVFMIYTDVPITNSKDDLLDRASFAKATARSLANMQDSGTFTVGLFGKWGTGKTSLLNMILQEVRALEATERLGDETIIIRFEPWNFSNSDQLLSQFFVRLISAFYTKSDKNLQAVSNAFEKYLLSLVGFTKLIPIVGEQVNDVARSSFSWFKRKATKGASETDVMLQKENVVKLLEKTNRRILIVIDDIDRLSNEQIRCVFQLVTSVAKFPKTTYLLAFDKEIVARALEEVQKGNGEEYLEKVIQIPIQIPALWQGKVEEILFRRLDGIIEENGGFHFEAKYWKRQYPACVKPFVQTLRDVNRLCNAVRFKIQGIADDLNFTDIVSITALEITYPAIYDWILANKVLLTGGIDNSLFLSYGWKKKDWERLSTEQWEQLLGNTSQTGSTTQKLEEVTNAITHLFPYLGNKLEQFHTRVDPIGYQELRAENHIAHPEKFDRYFEFKLGQSAISYSDLSLLLNGLDENGVIEYLKATHNSEKMRELIEEIHAHSADLPSERAKVLINAIFKSSSSFQNDNASFFHLGNRTNIEFLLRYLFAQVPEQERFSLLKEITQSADAEIFDMVANILNTTELAHGRLAAEGKPRDSIKILTLEELLQWEQVFVERAKQLLKTKMLFEFSNGRMILHLLEQFDQAYTTDYMLKTLSNPVNTIKYLALTTAEWTGSGIEYEVQNNYQKYISEQQLVDAISLCKQDMSLFRTDEQTQLMCAVFFLFHEQSLSDTGHVSAEKAHNLLIQWQEEAAQVT